MSKYVDYLFPNFSTNKRFHRAFKKKKNLEITAKKSPT